MLSYLNTKMINIFDEATLTKNDILKMMVSNIYENSDLVTDKEAFFSEVLEREKVGTTGIGMGIAIPHARTDAVKDLVLSVALVKHPVDFNSLDGEGVDIIVLVGAPKSGSKKYLELLANLSRVFRDRKNRESIIECTKKSCLIEALAEIV